jgi:hypothetical protein
VSGFTETQRFPVAPLPRVSVRAPRACAGTCRLAACEEALIDPLQRQCAAFGSLEHRARLESP